MWKRETVVALFVSTLALLVSTMRPANMPDNEPLRTIEVTATGEAYRVVDAVAFSLGHSSQSILPNELDAGFVQSYNYINQLDADLSLYVSSSSLRLPANSTSLEFSTNTSVTLYDLNQYSALLEHIAGLNNFTINHTRFFVADTEAMYLEAEADALQEGHITANRIADQLGATLGDLISIENVGYVHSPHYDRYRYDEINTTTELDFAPPLTQTSVHYTIVYELE